MDPPSIGVDSNAAQSVRHDGLGSTIGTVNSSGQVTGTYQYGPFGATTSSGSPGAGPFEYAGRELDPTGLMYMRNRYYRPGLQRFISPDPLGFGGGDTNLYAYVQNDPANLIDPTGFSPGGGGIPAPTGPAVPRFESTNGGDSWFPVATAEVTDVPVGAGGGCGSIGCPKLRRGICGVGYIVRLPPGADPEEFDPSSTLPAPKDLLSRVIFYRQQSFVWRFVGRAFFLLGRDSRGKDPSGDSMAPRRLSTSR